MLFVTFLQQLHEHQCEIEPRTDGQMYDRLTECILTD